MAKNKLLFCLTILLLLFTKFTFADNDIQMLVKFQVANSQLISNAQLGSETESYTMSCSGMTTSAYPQGYSITGYNQTSQGMVINVNGPFPNDPRESCTIYDQTTGNTNNVYFSVESMPLFFQYGGVQHSCYINQKVGTSWNNADRQNNKLQGAQSAVFLPCNGVISTDSYQVNSGSGDDKGNITISAFNPESNLSDINLQVQIDVPDPKLLKSIRLKSNYNVDCPSGNIYSISVKKNSPVVSGRNFKIYSNILVTGPFAEDQRHTCQIIDSTTQNTNNVYFSVENMTLLFDYDGTEHSCIIQQRIGTSYDVVSGYNDKLQGAQSDTYLNCNGSVKTDTYQVFHGRQTSDSQNPEYNPGGIIIKI